VALIINISIAPSNFSAAIHKPHYVTVRNAPSGIRRKAPMFSVVPPQQPNKHLKKAKNASSAILFLKTQTEYETSGT
jgi:hypothetical protein